MVTILPKFHYRRSPKGMKKAYDAARPKAMQRVGQEWHRKYLPLHFTRGAYSRYRYKARTVPYEKRKARVTKQNAPLVFRGVLRKAVTAGAVIVATANRVRVKMTGPKWLAGYIAFRGRRGTGPDKRKEIITIVDQERGRLGEVAKIEFARALDGARSDG